MTFVITNISFPEQNYKGPEPMAEEPGVPPGGYPTSVRPRGPQQSYLQGIVRLVATAVERLELLDCSRDRQRLVESFLSFHLMSHILHNTNMQRAKVHFNLC